MRLGGMISHRGSFFEVSFWDHKMGSLFQTCSFHQRHHWAVELITLRETNSLHLKIDGWKLELKHFFSLGSPTFRGYLRLGRA